jgi:hypothetical protein
MAYNLPFSTDEQANGLIFQGCSGGAGASEVSAAVGLTHISNIFMKAGEMQI